VSQKIIFAFIIVREKNPLYGIMLCNELKMSEYEAYWLRELGARQ